MFIDMDFNWDSTSHRETIRVLEEMDISNQTTTATDYYRGTDRTNNNVLSILVEDSSNREATIVADQNTAEPPEESLNHREVPSPQRLIIPNRAAPSIAPEVPMLFKAPPLRIIEITKRRVRVDSPLPRQMDLEKLIFKTAKESPEEASEDAPEETPEEAPEETPEEAPQQTPEEAPEEAPEETPEEAPEEAPEETPEEAMEAENKRRHEGVESQVRAESGGAAKGRPPNSREVQEPIAGPSSAPAACDSPSAEEKEIKEWFPRLYNFLFRAETYFQERATDFPGIRMFVDEHDENLGYLLFEPGAKKKPAVVTVDHFMMVVNQGTFVAKVNKIKSTVKEQDILVIYGGQKYSFLNINKFSKGRIAFYVFK